MLQRQIRSETSRVRLWILCLILFLSVVAYADRSILSISGSAIKEEFGLSAIQLGLILSAFSWAYVIGQIPGGLLLDRFGTKKVYGATLVLWSVSTLLMGFVGEFSSGVTMTLTLMFALRFALGLIEAPSFPANARSRTRPRLIAVCLGAIFCRRHFFAHLRLAGHAVWLGVAVLCTGHHRHSGRVWLDGVDAHAASASARDKKRAGLH